MTIKSTTLVQALGLLAVLVGLMGVAVIAYLHANPLQQLLPRAPSLPLVSFMGTAWGIITNGAFAIAGIGICRLKNWGRVLAMLYAVLSIIEFIVRSASIAPLQLPSRTQFVLLAMPIAVWVALIVVLTRQSVASKFEGFKADHTIREQVEAGLAEDSFAEVMGRGSREWSVFAGRFLSAFALYAGASHFFSPYPMIANSYSPLQVLVYYVAGYLTMFFVPYLAISVPTVVVAKLIPKYRFVPVPRLLNKTLLPALIVGGLMIYFGWYGSRF